ncbi:ABC transporter ATP-binding protein [Variovorax sp. WS11]|uniref:ABC transporter ATP-binding protein n=1 Tax=Variovorax sp. WS11 TaxID=1105204 RepID=UPI000D0D1461|nr:ABC transporter ATP-binding protein [Variovorax sp. WS11]NDZ17339.1 ABC transporter ATP-binding protein [Variovorax sp. WS11]PSL86121.1 ABC transporter ATP-binding protein [Variovorax sp. WS11]
MLTIDSLSAGYGALTILQGVSMRVEAGEAVAVVGPNGAGKTTLVRALCGLIPATGGRLAKDGTDLGATPATQRPARGLAVVLEGRHLFGELTVRENLVLAERHGLGTRKDHRRFSLDEVMALFPILDERRRQRVQLLSGGQQQMVAIGRALLLQPDLLIMDEPSTGLAPKVFKDIQVVFDTLRSRRVGLLLIEQNVRIAAAATERAYVMAMGRVIDELHGVDWQQAVGSDRLARAYLGGHSEARSTPIPERRAVA